MAQPSVAPRSAGSHRIFRIVPEFKAGSLILLYCVWTISALTA
jgi:hypothetical protein